MTPNLKYALGTRLLVVSNIPAVRSKRDLYPQPRLELFTRANLVLILIKKKSRFLRTFSLWTFNGESITVRSYD